jgi:hypothetical protein
MPRFLKIILVFLAGLIAGWAIPIVWYIVATNYFGLHDRDGGGAMGAIFIMGPISGLIVGMVVATITGMKRHAVSQDAKTQTDRKPR